MNLNWRRVEPKDWETVVKFCKLHDFPFPDFKNILSYAIIEVDDKPVAFGYCKTIIEAVFIPDLTQDKRVIVESLKLLNKIGIEDSRAAGFDAMHSFVWYPGFADILKKHLNYSTCKGEAVLTETGLE